MSRSRGGFLAGFIALLSLSVFVAADGFADTSRTLYSFCHSTGCPDGLEPFNPLVADAAGNFFGTTTFGGNTSYHGTIYELKKQGKGWKFVSLYQFCTQANCTDGGGSYGRLVLDKAGNIYGTTAIGGIGAGVVFKLSRRGTYRVLYDFCSATQCADGFSPEAGLTYAGAETGALYDGTSPLYGTTPGGGKNKVGVVFRLIPGGSETVLYNFDSANGDGTYPVAPLVMDGSGKLFGTTSQGGTKNSGTVFSIAGGGRETILHSFCTKANCVDGASPGSGALLRDSAGHLFGTVPSGGKFGKGVVYELSGKSYEVLVDFCRKSGCTDGASPQGALTMDAAGNLYGVVPQGGTQVGKGGLVFEYNGKTRDLYSFCNNTNCPDGGAPYSRPLLDGAGHVFGTTTQGGDYNGGTIFELVR